MTEGPVHVPSAGSGDDPAGRAIEEESDLYARALAALRGGVLVRQPRSLLIRGELVCGKDVEIDADVIIEGTVRLGDGVKVGAHCILRNCTIARASTVHPYSMIEDADIGESTSIGPYGRVRPQTTIGAHVQIGNFVEVARSEIGSGSRINHLAFVGDATLAEKVTLGAGTITCNHDGVTTQRTEIGANAYVGSGCELVAPIRIGESAVVGAGSTLTRDAPAGELTIARARQTSVSRRKGGREDTQPQ